MKRSVKKISTMKPIRRDLAQSCAWAGGTLYAYNFVVNPAAETYDPGCGNMTEVLGTNGGVMPCGAQLTIDGKTEQYFCAGCAKEAKKILAHRAAAPIVTDEQIDAELSRTYTIGIFWSASDVQTVRPDLTVDRAWEVLQLCRDRLDAELGINKRRQGIPPFTAGLINWDTLRAAADELYPQKQKIASSDNCP